MIWKTQMYFLANSMCNYLMRKMFEDSASLQIFFSPQVLNLSCTMLFFPVIQETWTAIPACSSCSWCWGGSTPPPWMAPVLLSAWHLLCPSLWGSVCCMQVVGVPWGYMGYLILFLFQKLQFFSFFFFFNFGRVLVMAGAWNYCHCLQLASNFFRLQV